MSSFDPTVDHTAAISSGAPAGSPPDLVQLARTLLWKSPIIIALLLFGGVFGFPVQQLLPTKYTSSVSLLIDPRSPTSFGAQPEFADAVYVDTAKIASVASVILSSEVLDRVVRQEGLANAPEFSAPTVGIRAKLLSIIGLGKPAPQREDLAAREDRAAARLANAVRVDRVGFTYEITVAVTASTPEQAQRLAEAVAKAYLADQADLKTEEIRLDGEWLSQRLAELRQRLIQSEAVAEQIRHKYGLTETDKGPGATVDRQEITELNGQLVQAEADLASKKAQWDQVRRMQRAGGDLSSLPQAASDRVIQDLQVQKTQDLRQIALLESQTNARFPLLQNARHDLVIINTRIATEVEQITQGIRNEYEAAIARRDALERSLNQLIAAQDNSVTAAGRQELHQAETVVEANRELFNSLLSHWRDVELQTSRGQPEARIISEAKIPDRPSFPKPLLFVGGGAVLGACLGAVLVFLVPLLENRYISTAEVEKTLGTRVLAEVPRLKKRDLKSGKEHFNILEYMLRRPISPAAESLRTLRVLLGRHFGESCCVVQITSSVPGEGKSTVAASLALSAASAGIRTLLIDADTRFPSIAEMFGLHHSKGLTDLVRGTTEVRPFTQPYRQLPLAIIGAGNRDPLQPDLASSRHLARLVGELSKQFELLILDCPPVMPVSDAVAIAGLAKLTLLVIEWRSTPRAIVQQAMRALRQAGAPVAGVILNKIEVGSRSPYSYSMDYGR
jgi:polysaccharide biosynthesis transport protein